ncbi:MAG: CAP domain-containing protein [Deltaproteobacteria bacterium]|nr:CAP domain-containing protein [Deltaproteobacteria bacterium]
MLRRQIIAATVLFCLGCGAGSPKPAQEKIQNTDSRVGDEWATRYGGPTDAATLTDKEQTLWDRVSERAGVHCKHDPRLTHVARQYASDLAQSPNRQSGGDLDRLRFVLARSGAVDYRIQPVVAKLDDEGIESFVRLVAERQGNVSHCGLGVVGTGVDGRSVWIGVNRIVEVDPFPSTAQPGARITIGGKVLKRSRVPVQLFIGHPDGSVSRLPPVRLIGGGRFVTTVTFEEVGRYEIELLTDAGKGSETAILVPIFIGVKPDYVPKVTPDVRDGDNARSLDDTLLDYLNAARARHGLSLLIRDARLDRVAKAHSMDMAGSDFFGHVSPSRGTLTDRLANGGLSPARTAENVARSHNLIRIHRNLMDSPSHRVNILDSVLTHVGIGVVRDGKDLIVTEIFARW